MSDTTGAPVSDPNDEDRPGRDYTLLLLAIPVIVVLALVALGLVSDRREGAGPKMGGIEPGETAPEIRAGSWINGEPPALAGRVVVLDLWASWCGPCRQKAPEFVELHRKYGERGVVFIGLSMEDKRALPHMERFLTDTGITWPNGYEAEETIAQLRVEYIPRAWVIGGDAKVVWNEDSTEPIEKAIERALAAIEK